MTRKELEERVDEILFKQARGEKLTATEERILAYGYYAAGYQRRSTAVWVRPQREA